jgi:hypothetical protein
MFLLRKLFKLLLHGDSKPEPLQSFKEIALELVHIDLLQVVAAKLVVAAAGLSAWRSR